MDKGKEWRACWATFKVCLCLTRHGHRHGGVQPDLHLEEVTPAPGKADLDGEQGQICVDPLWVIVHGHFGPDVPLRHPLKHRSTIGASGPQVLLLSYFVFLWKVPKNREVRHI